MERHFTYDEGDEERFDDDFVDEPLEVCCRDRWCVVERPVALLVRDDGAGEDDHLGDVKLAPTFAVQADHQTYPEQAVRQSRFYQEDQCAECLALIRFPFGGHAN